MLFRSSYSAGDRCTDHDCDATKPSDGAVCRVARAPVIHDDRSSGGEEVFPLFSEVKLQASVSSVASSNAEHRGHKTLEMIWFFCENDAGAKRAAAGG